MPTDRVVAAAARDLLDEWDGHTVYDLAVKLTRGEMEALANLLHVVGRTGDARQMMQHWIEGEIEDGECREGDWIIEEVEGQPVLEWTQDADGPQDDGWIQSTLERLAGPPRMKG
jgi:hypothetical protein